MSAHTPDPWRIVSRTDGLANVYAGPTAVALCIEPRDAALIAAAPELLDALCMAEGALASVRDHENAGEENPGLQAIHRHIVATLAKVQS